MAEENNIRDYSSDLRQRAEEMLLEQYGGLDRIPLDDVRRIFHELQVYQIELEIQNEELRRTQQELEASREKYFDLYDLAPVGYATLDEKGIILEANHTAAALLGKTRSDLVRQPFTRCIFREDQDIYYRHHKRLFETRQHQECRVRMIKGDGSLLWARLESSAAKGTDAGPASRTAIIDITQVKMAAEALEKAHDQSERRVEKMTAHLAAIVQSAEDAIISEDMKGLVLTWNVGAEKIFGYTAEESIGRNISVLVPPGHADEVPDILRRISRGKHIDSFETVRMRKDGTIIPVSLTFSPIKDGSGGIVGVSKIAHDLTRRERSEVALGQSEERYRTLFNTLMEGFCIIEVIFDFDDRPVDYRFLEINPAFEAQTGLQNAQGRLMRELAPDHEAHWFDIYGKIALTGEPARFVNEARALNRWYDVYAYRYGRPEARQVAIIFNDITEIKNAEEVIVELNRGLASRNSELVAANRELEAFSYSVSHDLRAPLRHISSYMELLNKNLGSQVSEKAKHYMTVIAGASKKMGLLIDDLLAFSRMGRTGMKKTTVNILDIVKDVIKEMATDIKERDVEWKIGALPDVHGDATMLRLAIVNLIANAIKYTASRSRAEIEIGYTEKGGEFIFFVEDNGIGFDMKYVDKLFGVFQRLHTENNIEGTGIGLANVRRIISRHGGRTWAEGSVGQGAVFYFTIPKSREV